MKTSCADIKEFIASIRESDRHIKAIFTLGGCYRFVKMMQGFFDGVVPMIFNDGDHCAALIDGKLYDITGELDPSGFREAIVEDLVEMETWSFDRHHLLAVGECPVCEEPISAGVLK